MQRVNIFPALNKSALATPKRKFVETPVVMTSPASAAEAGAAAPPSSKRMRLLVTSSPAHQEEEESDAFKECMAKLDKYCKEVSVEQTHAWHAVSHISFRYIINEKSAGVGF